VAHVSALHSMRGISRRRVHFLQQQHCQYQDPAAGGHLNLFSMTNVGKLQRAALRRDMPHRLTGKL